MSQIISFEGRLYEFNPPAFDAPLMILRDPYQPTDFVSQYLIRGIGGSMLPNPAMIISLEDTDRHERADALRKRLYRMPKRLRPRYRQGRL